MKKLVVLSGAGISAESGLKTFRDADGLWEGHSVTEVATPEGWHSNPALVLEFYNQRRKQALEAKPNKAHEILKELEAHFEVSIITQNVDNFHEQAGSSQVIHLHGQLFQSRSVANESLIYEMDHWELKLGDLCEKGYQLRPNIVWFGEAVPMMDIAAEITQQGDILVIVGTSLVVYPAASLVHYVGNHVPVYIVDPHQPEISRRSNHHFIQEKATTGMASLKEILLTDYA
ncbi:SIR2 family NAD-dependent protein deacylase [Roseivirga echinicomitans]|uniref:NAD-dependent protein deacylase n=1 Tax=Roseivirga echinicomitans TaxID=296218 RepID=A0A150X298_9BACT|nr:NAD-dependent deacylase [Roseivirga echinicomitans]KYG72845.1 NAD-dependent deacylase [Roseivirga echinicomitans]